VSNIRSRTRRRRPAGLERAAFGCAALLALLAGAATPRAALAHGSAVSLSVWGNFNPTAAVCQREIGRGAARCGLLAWDVRRRCLLRQMAGETCDEAADDKAIDDARRAAFDAVRPRCSAIDLGFLQFRDLFDVQTDMVNYCRDLEEAAVSVVFNPFFAASDTPLDAGERACVETFAATTTKALRAALLTHETTLDRIAARSKPLAVKRADVAAAHASVAADAERLLSVNNAGCAEETFTALYGHPPADLIELVAQRADCLAAAAYPVDAYTCPAAVCGNGMNERGESCDDGNLTPGDGCDAECRRE